MQTVFETDDFGRLLCHISDGETRATVTAHETAGPAADLLAAIADARRDGAGECYWREGAGEYRWAFRTEGPAIRIAVLWSSGTLTGWEHVFWKEREAAEFEREVRAGLDRISRLK